MMNAGNKRLKLLLLTLAILACSVVALGGTLAGGVDRSEGKSAQTLQNDTANHLDYAVDILYADRSGGNYQTVLGHNPFAGALWCPGYTKVVYFKVYNHEAFALEATLDLKITDSEFGNTMTYAVLAPGSDGTLSQPGNWNEFMTASGNHNAVLVAQKDYNVFKQVLLQSGQETIYAVAIHMSEDASNQYQGKTMEINFDFRVDSDSAPTE